MATTHKLEPRLTPRIGLRSAGVLMTPEEFDATPG